MSQPAEWMGDTKVTWIQHYEAYTQLRRPYNFLGYLSVDGPASLGDIPAVAASSCPGYLRDSPPFRTSACASLSILAQLGFSTAVINVLYAARYSLLISTNPLRLHPYSLLHNLLQISQLIPQQPPAPQIPTTLRCHHRPLFGYVPIRSS